MVNAYRDSKLLFEISKPGKKGAEIPELDVPKQENLIPKEFLREGIGLPELNEVDVVRHYIGLSKKGFGVDNGFYPLGSCTMKYNPKINEDCARLDGFANAHPYQDSQGALQLMYELNDHLCEIT